jgi:GNAT superfamily N-acetyltransferase
MTAAVLATGVQPDLLRPVTQLLEAVLAGAARAFTPELPRRYIRSIRREDLRAIAEALPAAPYRTHAADLDWQRTGEVSELIAWDGSTPVGSGFIHWSGPRDASVAELVSGCPEIFRLEVLDKHRSKGFGAALVRELEELARARGVLRVGLGVGIANRRARALYERLGYRAVESSDYIDRCEYPDANGRRCTSEEPCVFMVKDLRSAVPAHMAGARSAN